LHCYVVARAGVKTPSGNAFTIGIYDPGKKAALVQKTVTIEEMSDGAYHTYDLGEFTFPQDAYVWVSPLSNPDQVEGVYVDRMFFVRANP